MGRTIALPGQSDPTSIPTLAPSETWLGLFSLQSTVTISFHPQWFLGIYVLQEPQLLPPLLFITRQEWFMRAEPQTSPCLALWTVLLTKFAALGWYWEPPGNDLFPRSHHCLQCYDNLLNIFSFTSPKMGKSGPSSDKWLHICLSFSLHSYPCQNWRVFSFTYSFILFSLPTLKLSWLPTPPPTTPQHPHTPQVYKVSPSCSRVDRLKENKEI